MDYTSLSQEEFDAVVTGELTHRAISIESELENVISGYFVENHHRRGDFQRLLLRRDGLSAQDKIEIVRAMLPLFGLTESEVAEWKTSLKQAEEFKSWRNATSHGTDVTPEPYTGELIIEIVSRAGVEKQVRITPASHAELIKRTDSLIDKLTAARISLFESFLQAV